MQENLEQQSAAASPEEKKGWRHDVVEWAKTIASAFAVYIVFTTVAFANYSIPSESMVPHLEVGDRVVISKFAYGYSRYSLPFDLGRFLPASEHRLFESYPRRGDVVVFIHPQTGVTLIKRAIGLPGDTIEMRNGGLWLNGARVPTSAPQRLVREAQVEDGGPCRETGRRFEERLPDGYAHTAHNITDRSGSMDCLMWSLPPPNFGPFVVPAGHVFFMGDNRDNSLDSRSTEGPAPIENLIGRAEIVYYVNPFGCGHDPTVACPMPRWMRPLHH